MCKYKFVTRVESERELSFQTPTRLFILLISVLHYGNSLTLQPPGVPDSFIINGLMAKSLNN